MVMSDLIPIEKKEGGEWVEEREESFELFGAHWDGVQNELQASVKEIGESRQKNLSHSFKYSVLKMMMREETEKKPWKNSFE